MKKFLLSIFAVMLAVFSVQAEEATLSFADKAQRTSYSKTQQVWAQNGITFTNNKASSTTNVADYAKPVRLYANSNIVVECTSGNITEIIFDCNNNSYATALKSSIGDAATASDDKVTVTLDGLSNSFTIAKLTAQVRMDALTVTYVASTDVSKPVTPTLTAGGNFVGSMMVEISCATEDVNIYYTTDGSEPTEDSEEYTKSFEITTTQTVKAIAVNEAGESGVATAVYTRVATTPEISFDGKTTFEESVNVTIAAADGTTAYYTLNGKTPTENSDKCPESLTIKADATLQVIAYDEDGYASPVVKQAFKKAASGAAGVPTGTATLVEDATDLTVGDQIVIVATENDYALSTTQNTNNRGQIAITKVDNNVELNDNVQVLTLENGTVDGTLAFNTGSGYLYAASSGSNHLKTQTTNNANGSWKIEISESGVATIKAQGSNTRNWLRYNEQSSLFSCYGSGQKDVSIYKVDIATVEDYVLNVSEAGWATMYLGYNVVIPEGVTCYTVAEVNSEKVTLASVTGILPANTAVIVEAKEGEYTFEPTKDNNENTIKNLMCGTTNNEYIEEDAYVLGNVEGVALYKAEKAGGVWLNNANKAYLPAEYAALSTSLRFDFGGTTAVEEVETEAAETVIYDLTGRRVNEITKAGVYVVGGKKILVK